MEDSFAPQPGGELPTGWVIRRISISTRPVSKLEQQAQERELAQLKKSARVITEGVIKELNLDSQKE